MRKIFATVIELKFRIITPMKKANGKRMKKIILKSGKNCQKYQNQIITGWALKVIIKK